MRSTRLLRVLRFAAVLSLIQACAHGPVTITAPSVAFQRLVCLSITPSLLTFQAQVLIRNRMPLDLPGGSMDYTIAVGGREIIRSGFDDLKVMRGNQTQTVTFPFQISMEDLLAALTDGLGAESFTVAFRGTYRPGGTYGFAAIAFAQSVAFPVPRLPEVALAGSSGSPLGERFEVKLRIRNPNAFPLTVRNVDTQVSLNDRRFNLLLLEESRVLEPGGDGVITLGMRNTTGKTISMVLGVVNAIQTGRADFNVRGKIKFSTPFAPLTLPIEVGGSL